MTNFIIIVYLENVIFNRLRRLSYRNYGCRRRPRYLIFSQFSICCCQNAFAFGALPGPRRGASSTQINYSYSGSDSERRRKLRRLFHCRITDRALSSRTLGKQCHGTASNSHSYAVVACELTTLISNSI